MRKIYSTILFTAAMLIANAQFVEIDTSYTNNGRKAFNPQFDQNQNQFVTINDAVSLSDDYHLMLYTQQDFNNNITYIRRYEKTGSGNNDFAESTYYVWPSGGGFADGRTLDKVSDGVIASSVIVAQPFKISITKFDDSMGTSGMLDNGFGNNGVLEFNSPSQNNLFQPKRILEKSDGSYYLIAEQGFPSTIRKEISILKITSSGAIDSTFGSNGYVYHSVGDSTTRVTDALIDENDNLYITGQMEAKAPDSEVPSFSVRARMNYVMKCNADGSWDTGFGSYAFQSTQYNVAGFDFTSANIVSDVINIEMAPNGDLLVFGRSTNSNPGLVRIDSDGNLISSFGNNGVVRNNTFGNNSLFFQGGKVMDDGTIILLNEMRETSTDVPSAGVILLNKDGVLDSTEQENGRLVFGFPQENLFRFNITENKLMFFGFEFDGNGNGQIVTYRLNYKNSNSVQPGPTSIKNKLENTIKVYPNPTKDFLIIEGLEDESIITLFDLQGKEIKINKTEDVLDVSHLVDGVYILQIQNSSERTLLKLLVE